MRRLPLFLFSLLCAFFCELDAFSQAAKQGPSRAESVKHRANDSAPGEVRGYHEIQAVLRGRTKVPLRLPTFIPSYSDEENPLFAILQSADPQGYDVELAWADPCGGANWCHIGEIVGSSRPIPSSEGHRTPVSLHSGLTGYFIEFTCGAHCDDSEIQWTESGYHYSIRGKAEKRTVLMKMVDSAIEHGRPQSQ